MDRYWRELEAVAQDDPLENAEITNVFGQNAPSFSRRSGRFQRAITKYAMYPWRVRFLRNAQLVHLLDHSYAHLLPLVPSGRRIVATVFDLVPLRDPDSLLPHQVDRFRKSVRNLRLADRIIAVSRETADDLVQILGIVRDRICVVFPGTNPEKFSEPTKQLLLSDQVSAGRKIVLSVGSAQPRKNLVSLPKIFSPLAERFQRGDWIFARMGELLPKDLERSIVEVIGAKNMIQLGPRSGAEVIGVFQQASVFMLPSVLEGFSFTMMEAMAAGAPVVANRMSTNPEVGEDAVLYYENGDHDGAARSIREVLDDPSCSRRLREAGLKRVRRLSWRNHWASVKEVYQDVIQGLPKR